MATVFIPSLLRTLTGGADQVQAHGHTLRQLIADLDRRHPGLREALIDDERDAIAAPFAVVIDGSISHLGLLQRLEENADIVFIPAMEGG